PMPPRSNLFPYTTLFRSKVATTPQKYINHSAIAAGLAIGLMRQAPYVWKTTASLFLTPSTAVSLIARLQMVKKTLSVVTVPCHRSEEHTSELQSRENLVC